MNEKMKVEECVKKGKERYEESRQRAVAAEVRRVTVFLNACGRLPDTITLALLHSYCTPCLVA